MTSKNVEDFYPLSPMQQGMLFHSLQAPGSGLYVEQMSWEWKQPVNVEAFRQAWQFVIDRHPVLRTGFRAGDLKEPVQVVHKRVAVPLRFEDWSELGEHDYEARLVKLLESERTAGFDVGRAPLMRLVLIARASGRFDAVWTYHHLLLDGWSVPIVLREVLAAYIAFGRGKVPRLPEARPYRDYIHWLRRQDSLGPERFWRSRLSGFLAATPLPAGSTRPATGSEGSGFRSVQLDETDSAGLLRMCRSERVTINTVVQAAWALLLSRYSGEDDVLYGAVVAGRPAELDGAEHMIGLFINTIPVRVRVPPAGTASDWVRELQSEFVELRSFEHSALSQVQQWSEIGAGQPLFHTLVVCENYPIDASLADAGETIGRVRSAASTNYPLTAVATPGPRLSLDLAVDASRFDPVTIDRLLGHWQSLIRGLGSGPHLPVTSLEVLLPSERKTVLSWSVGPNVAIGHACVHQMFEAQVQRTPNAIAVQDGGTCISYRNLNGRANRLKHVLARAGVDPETRVGLFAGRSADLVVGVLGILKAGGAYVPLDPAYPAERLRYIAADCAMPLVVTQRALAERLPFGGRRVIFIEDVDDAPADTNPHIVVYPSNLAYAIYTSGSTGNPKGVLIQHGSVSNLVTGQTRQLGLGPGCRVLQLASISFDAAVSEIFMALTTGATLHTVKPEAVTSPVALFEYLREQAISVVTLPPSLLAVLPEADLPELRTIISAGEACTWDVMERWSNGRRIFNGYGPTESTVGPTLYELQPEHRNLETVPVGTPLPNTSMYVLDAHLRLAPIGAGGELHIGGAGVARGYLNRPDLTAEKFIPNPFSAEPGARLYRTGDRARCSPAGCIEFLGRVDEQVKLRGFRIELGEIEAVLDAHPSVSKSAVVVRTGGENQNTQLIAYYVTVADQAVDGTELKMHLRRSLPEYMIPGVLIQVDDLPRTPNGKVDRRALAKRSPVMRDSGPVAARDLLELELTQIWEGVLGTGPVGVTESFFELGGNSINAFRLVAQIEKRMGMSLTLAELVAEPTVEHVARLLRQRRAASNRPSLVGLQPRGNKDPIFFVHPSGGSVHWFAGLARHLGTERPFYAFQCQGLLGEGPIHTTVEDMARHYVEELLAFRPDGPYLLGSWSMGVVVAFEMAQQLVRQGKEVSHLVLLDQGPDLPAGEPEDDAAYLVSVFGKHVSLSVEDLRQLDRDGQIAYVLERAKQANWVYPDITVAQFAQFIRLLRTHTEAWRRYVPCPYPGRIVLVRAAEQPEACEPDLGWHRLAQRGVVVCETPSDHLGMMAEPHVAELAHTLRRTFEELGTKRQEHACLPS